MSANKLQLNACLYQRVCRFHIRCSYDRKEVHEHSGSEFKRRQTLTRMLTRFYTMGLDRFQAKFGRIRSVLTPQKIEKLDVYFIKYPLAADTGAGQKLGISQY